ncbi:hypothetical protein PG989_010486 [Apiospora arundinis]
MLVETADLSARFVIDFRERREWAIIPTTASTAGAGRGLATKSCRALVVLQYGFYGSLEAMLALQNYTSFDGMMQDPLFIHILILEYILRSSQTKITSKRHKL